MKSTILLTLAAATKLATAQHGSATPSVTSAASTTASPSATLIPSNGRVPLFAYEEKQLTKAWLLNQSSGAASELLNFDSLLVGSNNGSVNATLPVSGNCRVFPGDQDWPKASEWQALNSSSGGSLLVARPEASICYEGSGNYNSSACSQLTANWTNSYAR